MRVALGQIDTTVGDLRGNADKIIAWTRRAAERKADVVVFPELAINGYPPRDLVEKVSFVERTQCELRRIAPKQAPSNLRDRWLRRRGGGLGGQARYEQRRRDRERRNQIPAEQDAAAHVRRFRRSALLRAGRSRSLAIFDGLPAALTICEDAWNDKQFWERRLYRRDPVEELAQAGGAVLISINASPYHMGKRELRREIFAATARRYNLPVVYVNQVGGNDQLVFDGSSFAMDAHGDVIAARNLSTKIW